MTVIQADPTISALEALRIAKAKMNELSDAIAQQLDAVRVYANNAMTELSTSIESIINLLDFETIRVDNTGKTEVTAGIQKYLSKAGKHFLPEGDYLVNALTSIMLKSNTDLVMHPNARLIVMANDEHGYAIFRAEQQTDITIFGGQLLGDRNKHTYTIYPPRDIDIKKNQPNPWNTHEWGMGISIKGCQRVTIDSVVGSEFTGDAFTVGPSGGGEQEFIPSQEIILRNLVSTRNRRQGLSITNVWGIKVLNCQFLSIGIDDEFSKGTSPRCGIDIEPGWNDKDKPAVDTDMCRDVLIDNCTFGDNEGYGLNIFLRIDNVTVIRSKFFKNRGCGIVAVSGTNLNFIDNEFEENESTGLNIKKDVISGSASGNKFRLNYSKQGPKLRATPLVNVDGLPDHVTRDLLYNVADPSKFPLTHNSFA